MAYLPKTTAIAPAAPALSARSLAPSSRVAAVSTSEVDALESGTNISFDASASGFQAEQQRESTLSRNGDNSRNLYREPSSSRLFTADSQSFAEIFEANPNENTRGSVRSSEAVVAQAPVSEIIRTYETNALIIAGEQPIRGTSLSFSL